jgi:hypothetical protein
LPSSGLARDFTVTVSVVETVRELHFASSVLELSG